MRGVSQVASPCTAQHCTTSPPHSLWTLLDCPQSCHSNLALNISSPLSLPSLQSSSTWSRAERSSAEWSRTELSRRLPHRHPQPDALCLDGTLPRPGSAVRSQRHETEKQTRRQDKHTPSTTPCFTTVTWSAPIWSDLGHHVGYLP